MEHQTITDDGSAEEKPIDDEGVDLDVHDTGTLPGAPDATIADYQVHPALPPKVVLVPLEPASITTTLKPKTALSENSTPPSRHALHEFAVDHFVSAPPRRRWGSPFRKPQPFDLETRLRWDRQLLKTPLTRGLKGDQIATALQAFRNISGFMGNRSSGKGQIDHCYKLLRNVMPRATAIKDEIYCQLCKQLTKNPDSNATANGWLLVCACLVTFPPSSRLAPFMERFFADHIGDGDIRVSQFATNCLASLHEWTTKGKTERNELPSLMEIESLRDNRPVNVPVFLIDGSSHEVAVNSWTTCAQLSDLMAERLHLNRRQAFTVFEVSAAGEERRVDPQERVLDLLSLWERLGVEKVPKKKKKKNRRGQEPIIDALPLRHHVLYKVYLNIPLDDDMIEDLELVYKQAVHDVVHATIVCPLSECIQLASFQLFVAHGPWDNSKDLEALLPSCMPRHLLSKSNSKEIAAKIKDVYQSLSPMTGTSDGSFEDLNAVSAQQIRHAYLKLCSGLRLYGSTFFVVHNTRDRSMPTELVLAVHHKGISLVSVANEAVLKQLPYVSIATWGYSSNAFVFVVGATTPDEDDEVEYVLKTKMGKAINDIVAAYVAYILSSSSQASMMGRAG